MTSGGGYIPKLPKNKKPTSYDEIEGYCPHCAMPIKVKFKLKG